MKHYKQKLMVALGSTLAFAGSAQADIVTDATAELASLKTSAESMGSPIMAIVAVITLIGIVVMLMRRAK